MSGTAKGALSPCWLAEEVYLDERVIEELNQQLRRLVREHLCPLELPVEQRHYHHAHAEGVACLG
jgi:hypothetical protein